VKRLLLTTDLQPLEESIRKRFTLPQPKFFRSGMGNPFRQPDARCDIRKRFTLPLPFIFVEEWGRSAAARRWQFARRVSDVGALWAMREQPISTPDHRLCSRLACNHFLNAGMRCIIPVIKACMNRKRTNAIMTFNRSTTPEVCRQSERVAWQRA